ncbi:unnamed protein product [Leuciscus chuanchicus]
MIGTEERRDEDYACDRRDEAGDRNKTADEDEDDDETDMGKWRKTRPDELLAGNISRCLSMDVLRVISSEVRKSTRLHDDVIMEMMLCQKILKECSGTASQVAGYIQHLQVDPFGVHLEKISQPLLCLSSYEHSIPTLTFLADGNTETTGPDNDTEGPPG